VSSITDGPEFISNRSVLSRRSAAIQGLSVRRVWFAAQIKGIKQVAGKGDLDLAQYRELLLLRIWFRVWTPDAERDSDRGQRIVEFLSKTVYPIPVEEQVAVMWR